MTIYTKTSLSMAILAVTLVACADAEPPPDARAPTAAPAPDVFGSSRSNQPPPAEEVFLPDVFAENDGSVTLGFRMPEGYYIYKDKITLRSLSVGVELGELDLPSGETVIDDWFGEQEVYFFDMMANAPVTRSSNDAISVEVEVTWQGCKTDELCYLPVSKIIPVELVAQVESAAD